MSYVLVFLALVLAAAGTTVHGHSFTTKNWPGQVIGILMIGLALCMCIEAGRHWT